jgi:PAS domain S-box-containing protein
MGSAEQKIMVVEDEGLIAADLQSRLERVGYSVPPVAGTGAEALKIIRETSPDLVLMDIRLRGDLDGIEVAEQVRRELDIPVVYLTAYEDQETLERAGHSQAFGYIRKPIASASLQGAIEMALSKHRFERHLREQRDWLSASFAAVPDAVLVTDNSGRICYLNRVAEEMTGCTSEQALGRPSSELLWLVYPDGEPVEDLVRVVLIEGEMAALPGNVCLQGGQGRRYAVEGSVEPRRNEGHLEGAIVVLRDVTERRFAEEVSRQEDKHDALMQFADGIAGHLDPELSAVARQGAHLLGTSAEDRTAGGMGESDRGQPGARLEEHHPGSHPAARHGPQTGSRQRARTDQGSRDDSPACVAQRGSRRLHMGGHFTLPNGRKGRMGARASIVRQRQRDGGFGGARVRSLLGRKVGRAGARLRADQANGWHPDRPA